MFQFYYVVIIIILMTIALVKEFYRPSILIFTALILMYAGGIISLDQTFMGFSNHGMLTVAVLFVVAKGLQS
ncbi:MAG TPA: SLC13 family permease, partial [bacterium]|nr:SLC13 family permease [bacterium]